MLTIKALSQSECGMQEYYDMSEQQTFTLVPIVYFQTRHNWYFEGRYNYEALNTASAYAGKVFEKKAAFSYSFNPVLGLVAGKFNGGSAGMNIEANYKKISFSSQSQFTFSLINRDQNFTYSWSELSYNAANFLEAGISLQQSGEYETKNKFDKGVFLKLECSRWTLPFYVFKKSGNEKFFVLSLIYEWTHTNTFRNKNNRNYNNN